MVGWTKADYDDAYQFRAERSFGGRDPGRAEVTVNYVRWAIQPILADMWARLAPILNIASTEHVLIVGCGFGWGAEAFIAETGANTIGIEISDYIESEKANTEEADIRASIAAVGLDPDIGRGLELMGHLYDAQPRASGIVFKEDMSTITSRQNIREALGNNWPSVVVFEDIISEPTLDAEITQAKNNCNLFPGNQRVIWITPRGYPGRTLAELQTLTGAEVITRDGQTHLVS